ncbi:AAR2 splicing factor family protein [Aspergillus clavatus NRRL 1]|uniref:AAR2 domain protein n=1 Tax=Aspergillus clavatus (strain ATCC 1007 / CBS 513.65 / DSM 816 / NCTC 3887 / NRRL 1 / QM 1276 / 107) TaxID=344612 RepID=A1C694_ASPCL|nr:AAR2 domain protein [Aspergillus clavatus NRRL 1]EAW13915.1 AAR2 domain protein [Aspergillus clavatus NRRL 1]
MPLSLIPSPTILVPQLPPKTLVGIDLVTFTSTPNFHGIRDLPSGWHFLYTGTTASFSLRCGAWFYVGNIGVFDSGSNQNNAGTIVRASAGSHGPDIYIWKWNSESETMEPLRADSEADRQEAMRHKANLGTVAQRGGLFSYRSRVSSRMIQAQSEQQGPMQDEIDEEEEQEGRKDWADLTKNITPKLFSRIRGDPELDVDNRPRWMVTTGSSAERDSDRIPGLEQNSEELEQVTGEPESEFAFLPVDLKRTWREGAVGRERTEAAQDRSWALGDLVDRYSDNEGKEGGQSGEAQILGELQFTFLMVLTLMNYSCLQQWKRLLELVLTCQNAIKTRESFMASVLRLLLLQLKRCDDVEGGLFDIDGEEGGEFLRRLLMKFRRSLYEVVDNPGAAVKTEFDKLATWVKNEYDWELNREAIVRRGMVQLEDGEQVELEMNDEDGDDETGEYAPIVVDLEEGTTAQDLDIEADDSTQCTTTPLPHRSE